MIGNSKNIKGESHLLILMYHRIRTDNFLGINKYYDAANVLLKNDVFLKQIDFIARNYKVIRLSDVNYAMASRMNSRGNICALTFDDGFSEHYNLVFPLLKKYNITATFFVPTQHLVEKTPRWLDVMYYIFSHTKVGEVKLTTENKVIGKFNIKSNSEVKILKNILKKMNSEKRCVAMKELADKLKVNINNEKIIREFYISENNIREMSKEGMEFGVHTVSHPLLTAISAKDARMEIGNSKRTILKLSKQKKISFAYPFGGLDSYDGSIISIVKSLGFENACTSIPGINSSNTDRYRLKRVAAEKFISSED